jgi:hypothetical protein
VGKKEAFVHQTGAGRIDSAANRSCWLIGFKGKIRKMAEILRDACRNSRKDSNKRRTMWRLASGKRVKTILSARVKQLLGEM